MRIPGAASDLGAAHTVAVVLQLHNGRLFNGLCERWPSAAALKLVRGGKERFSGDDINIDARLKLVPEFAREGAFCAVFLCDAILLISQLVTNGFGGGLFVVAGVDAQL